MTCIAVCERMIEYYWCFHLHTSPVVSAWSVKKTPSKKASKMTSGYSYGDVRSILAWRRDWQTAVFNGHDVSFHQLPTRWCNFESDWKCRLKEQSQWNAWLGEYVNAWLNWLFGFQAVNSWNCDYHIRPNAKPSQQLRNNDNHSCRSSKKTFQMRLGAPQKWWKTVWNWQKCLYYMFGWAKAWVLKYVEIDVYWRSCTDVPRGYISCNKCLFQ